MFTANGQFQLQCQDYYQIKSNCTNLKVLFEDKLFLADYSVLPRKYFYDKIEWKRPHVYDFTDKYFSLFFKTN